MGRPSKLTPETQAIIIANMRIGLRYKDAALAACVTYQTIRNWTARGEKAKSGKYAEFFVAVKRAQAEGERLLLARIQDAARKQWQAAAWILERRYPDKWARREHIKQEVKGKVKIKLVFPDAKRSDD